MHFFAEKPKAKSPTKSSEPSSLRLQQFNTEEHNPILTGTALCDLGHDFSRISLSHPETGAIQTKLTINKPGDECEREADRAAEQVMQMPKPLRKRACQCGGEYPKCQKEEPLRSSKLQSENTSQEITSPLVRQVLTSPGQPLDTISRSFFEQRFGQDFSRVRIHTDVAANTATRQLNARAFAHRYNIFFGAREFAPESLEGRRLLAHELSHVVQQTDPRVSPSLPGTIQPEIQLQPEKSQPALQAPTESTDKTEQEDSYFPGFSQTGPTCAVASIASALMIWDKEQQDRTAPNRLVETACNILLIYMENNESDLKTKWDDKTFKKRTISGEKLYNELYATLMAARDVVRQPGYKIQFYDYTAIVDCFYALNWNKDEQTGIDQIQPFLDQLGLNTHQSVQADSFSYLMQSSVLEGLAPGQIAQVTWRVFAGTLKEGRVHPDRHTFLIGRFEGSGDWFLSDQGQSPPLELKDKTLLLLQQKILKAIKDGESWIYPGGPLPPEINPKWTGVRLISDRSQIEKKAENVVLMNGDFLAEVDAGVFSGDFSDAFLLWGSKIMAGEFVARSYNLNDAIRCSGSGFGSVIVEIPLGLFHIYKTNTVSAANLGETKIDERHSKGGKLEKHKIFYHAWLRLCSPEECNSTFFQVF